MAKRHSRMDDEEVEIPRDEWAQLGDVVIFEFYWKNLCLPRQGRVVAIREKQLLQLPGWLPGGGGPVEVAPRRVGIASPLGKAAPQCLYDLYQRRRIWTRSRYTEREVETGYRIFWRDADTAVPVGGPEDPIEVYW